MIITGGTVFLVVSVSMLDKLRRGVLGVTKITNQCVYVHAVWRTCPYECVFCDIRVVFAYNYCLLFFIHEIYFWVTSPNPIWRQSLNSSRWVFNSNDQFILNHNCLCHLPALVDVTCIVIVYLISVLLINLCKHVKAFFL